MMDTLSRSRIYGAFCRELTLCRDRLATLLFWSIPLHILGPAPTQPQPFFSQASLLHSALAFYLAFDTFTLPSEIEVTIANWVQRVSGLSLLFGTVLTLLGLTLKSKEEPETGTGHVQQYPLGGCPCEGRITVILHAAGVYLLMRLLWTSSFLIIEFFEWWRINHLSFHPFLLSLYVRLKGCIRPFKIDLRALDWWVYHIKDSMLMELDCLLFLGLGSTLLLAFLTEAIFDTKQGHFSLKYDIFIAITFFQANRNLQIGSVPCRSWFRMFARIALNLAVISALIQLSVWYWGVFGELTIFCCIRTFYLIERCSNVERFPTFPAHPTFKKLWKTAKEGWNNPIRSKDILSKIGISEKDKINQFQIEDDEKIGLVKGEESKLYTDSF